MACLLPRCTDGNDDYVYNHSTNKLEADSLALQELKSSTVDVLRKAFNLLDTDHSGFIEITVFIQPCCPYISPP